MIAAGWCVMRCVGLGEVPAGLSTDETLSGLHVACLGEAGVSADGTPWPLFAKGISQGVYTPTYLYSLLAWTRVFGIWPAGIRGFSAFVTLLAIAGIGLLVRRMAGARAARLAVVAAALSPWSFQIARLAVDAPMAPMFLVWGVYLFVRSPRPAWAAAGGIALALAATTYPPLRVQVPLVTLLLLFVERQRLTRVRVGALFGAMLVASLPVLVRMLQGDLLARSKELSIFNINYIKQHQGELPTAVFVVKQLMENLLDHLRPSYLFFTGDANIRHSTQIVGEMGWLDILALICFVATMVTIVVRAFRADGAPGRPLSRNWLIALAAIAAGTFGTLPSALCWEGLPHAFRSIGTWPAIAVFTGVSLSAVWSRHRIVPIAALILAIAQTVHFVPYYYGDYPKKSFDAWDGPLRAAARARDPVRFGEEVRKVRYDEVEFRYYLMLYFGDTCVSSRGNAERILNGLPSRQSGTLDAGKAR